MYLGRMVCFLVACTFFSVIYVRARERSQGTRCSSVADDVVHRSAQLHGRHRIRFERGSRPSKEWRAWSLVQLSARAPMIEIPMMIVLGLFGTLRRRLWHHGVSCAKFLAYACHVDHCDVVYGAMAQVYSVQFENPLLGILMFMNLVWGFFFSGLLIAGHDVIWPFRLFCYILPLKWGLRAMILSSTTM